MSGGPRDTPAEASGNGRWLAVGLVGVLCGLLLGGVVAALTGSLLLGALLGVPTAAILVVLGVLGSLQRGSAEAARAAHEARRERQRRAIQGGGNVGDRPSPER